ncbi:uncharacterized protein L201_001462 [Kwoniella dendrophila CBS 6074]|uniref:BZIP domain-containing protein n=1 Tax=Kwoniella dendrophila CBS 6074 TaxID=1295534 RepID=A0AAX4JPW4_9TREE
MHPYRTSLPSPATPLSSSIISPHKQHPPYGFPPPSTIQSTHHINMNVNMNHNLNHGHPNINHNLHSSSSSSRRPSAASSSRANHHHHQHHEYIDSESDGDDDKVEKDKLEIRREKNRVKQRNLRLRRANHIADLEKNLATIRAEHASLQSSFNQLHQRENALQGWVHDLESALFRNGMAAEVETLRRIWADRDASKAPLQHPSEIPHPYNAPPEIHHQLPTPSGSSAVDPLSTLAKAAFAAPPGSNNGPEYSERRMSHQSINSDASKPTLPRPSSFSKPFENPYPTPEIGWGSQMHEWVQTPQQDYDKKRRRDSYIADYPPPPPPSSRPGLHPMSGRLSESNVHTLPPIQSYRQSSPASGRPLSAPYQYQGRQSAPISATPSVPGTGNISPRSIRISDLVSPRASQISHDEASLPALSVSGGWSRSGSRADLSVTGERSGSSEWNQTSPFEILQAERGGNLSNFQTYQPKIYPRSLNQGEPILPTKGSFTKDQNIIVPFNDWKEPFTPITWQGTPTIGWPNTQIDLATDPVSEEDGPLIDPTPHPSVYTARILLLSILPQPISLDYPPVLPELFKEQQQILLTALSNLLSPEINEKFRAAQLEGLSAEDAKLLLQYQSSIQSDLRLVLFPVAILRAAVIRHIKSDKEGRVEGERFNLNAFITSTLREARIFGNPLDPDAWEMPDQYWDKWERWFPLGREYCHSLSGWRTRDGHQGSGVIEMLLGLKGERRRRRQDWIGKPPGWSVAKLTTK